jgi:hypothetical protein
MNCTTGTVVDGHSGGCMLTDTVEFNRSLVDQVGPFRKSPLQEGKKYGPEEMSSVC